MSPHLEEVELQAAARGEPPLPLERRAHLDDCASCRARLEEASTARTVPARPERAERVARVPPEPAERPQRAPEAEPAKAGRLPRGASLGRYLILDLLGEGGMGSVYSAYDAELDRKVAVKVLRADSALAGAREGQARLLREAQAMARIAHPNVIAVHDVGTVDDAVFLAMDQVQGRTLRAWLKEPRRPEEVLALFVQAGRGLLAAHRAGLVHRDFKPDNVLVGDDGRVFVTDFGLARLVSSPTEPDRPADLGSGEALPIDSPLTRAGTVMGTPRYMSPEQHLGKVPDARSDQFSFCAALYWGLFQVRPFEPDRLAEAARRLEPITERTQPVAAKDGPVVQEPPPKPRVAPPVRRALMRGLSLSPDERFPSMEALLEVLERPPRRALPWAVGAAAVLVVAALGVTSTLRASRADLVCSGAPQRLAGAWDGPVRSAIEQAFARAGGAAQFERVAAQLDGYAGAWSGQFHEACAATSIRREQPEQVLSLRMICLDRQLDELRELTHLFASADAKLVRGAVDAVAALPNVQACADVAALTRRTALPADSAARAAIRRAESLLASAEALKLVGHFPEARAKVDEVLKLAAPLDYAPLSADALYFEGGLFDAMGRFADGDRTLRDALAEADSGSADELRLQIANELVFSADQQSHLDEGHRWVQLGQAVLRRIGKSPSLESDLLNNSALLYLDEARYADAAKAFEAALARLEALPGVSPLKIATVQSNLALTYSFLHRSKDAEPLVEKVIAAFGRAYGPENATLADPYAILGQLYTADADYDRALEAIRHAEAVLRKSYGELHPKMADFYSEEATILQTAGRFEPARKSYLQSLSIEEKLLKPGNARFAFSYGGIGQCLVELGRNGEAVEWLEKALAIPLDSPEEKGNSQFALARALWVKRAEHKRARSLALEAKANYQRAGVSDGVDRVTKWLVGR